MNKNLYNGNNCLPLSYQIIKHIKMTKSVDQQNLEMFDKPLTFNEWSAKYQVSSRYIEPTKYFQNNPSCGYVEKKEEPKGFISKIIHLFS